MEKKDLGLRFGVVTLFVLIAAFSRLLPHPQNFAPISAMALFSAAYYNRKYFAFLMPILAMFLCDIVLNNVIYAGFYDKFVLFYPGAIYTYLSFIVIALVGFVLLKKVSVGRVIVSSLLASVIFFLISNFGTWASGLMPYTKDFSGLMTCYAAGIPFFKNTLMGDLFYCGVMFGIYELVKSKVPALKSSVI
ncbi:MAG: hypothetical protein J6T30_08300 [Bacteroidales bacterium]|nr:hypothetical protein [Bacteroidales bacterium]